MKVLKQEQFMFSSSEFYAQFYEHENGLITAGLDQRVPVQVYQCMNMLISIS